MPKKPIKKNKPVSQPSLKGAVRPSANFSEVPGIRVGGDGSIGFSVDNLPASTHFFDATHYVINANGENFVMLFGQKSVFSAENRYNLAVEISIPRYYANIFLNKSIFETPSIGEARPFIESVNESYNSLTVKDPTTISELLSLPADNNSFRRFSANFATMSMSGGQALIEFFEVPPDLLVNVVHNRGTRRGASAQSVISILTNISLLKRFLEDVRSILN